MKTLNLNQLKNLKFFFLLFTCTGLLFMSGCTDDLLSDPEPNIKFIGGSGYVDDDVTLEPGQSFVAGITASSNFDSGEDLSSFTVQRGSATEVNISNIDQANYTFEDTFTASTLIGDEEWVFTITDKAGESQNISFVVTTENPTNPLTAPANFTWERCGSNPGTGLDQFGLAWTQNAGTPPNTVAVIKKDAQKLVSLSSSEWNSIDTDEQLKAAVDAATSISDYRGVSANANDTYDDVIATIKNNTYYILHITNAEVQASISCSGGSGTSTRVTITGQSRSNN